MKPEDQGRGNTEELLEMMLDMPPGIDATNLPDLRAAQSMIVRDWMWQMDLLTPGDFDSYATKRELQASFGGAHISALWALALLRADLVLAPVGLAVDGLILADSSEPDLSRYCDTRTPIARPEGWVGSARNSPAEEKMSVAAPRFHPFRLFALWKLQRLMGPLVTPFQVMVAADRYAALIDDFVEVFAKITSSETFVRNVEYWNAVVDMCAVLEPCYYQRLFRTIRTRGGVPLEEHQERVDVLRGDVLNAVRRVPLEVLETVHRSLCRDAQTQDPNEDVHRLLRLSRGEKRIKLEGRLGAAMLCLTMAELIRRAAEEAFDVELPEEDECGWARLSDNYKREVFGVARVTEARRPAKRQLLEEWGLDSSVRINWYVEGTTEYFALIEIFDREGAIAILNLRGLVREKNVLAFRDNLDEDVLKRVFSFISVDKDRKDFVKVVRIAVREDRVCGRVFLSAPDFELQNFSKGELAMQALVLWADGGFDAADVERLTEALADVDGGEGMMQVFREFGKGLERANKGEEWGRALGRLARDQPELPPERGGGTRLISEAIDYALRAAGGFGNYPLQRSAYRLDPESFAVVAREPAPEGSGGV